MKLMKCFFFFKKKKLKIVLKRKFWGKKEGDGVVGGSGEWIKRPLPAGGWSRRLKRNIFFKKKKSAAEANQVATIEKYTEAQVQVVQQTNQV